METAAQLGIPLAAVELERPLAQRLFAAPLALVRPDQHVAWRGSEVADPERLLRTVTGHTRS